jgi:RND family efflux transporter MFP subunit
MNKRKRIIQIVVTVVILAVGVAGLKIIVATRPEAERTRPTVHAPMVRVVAVKTGPHAMVLKGQGTVTPEKEIQLVPQVSGKVVFVSPALVDGGAFKKGDVLLRIDPADYEIAVTLAQARIKDAESKYTMAGEEAEAARYEWHQLSPDKDPPSLVIKEPQLAAARALLAAEAANLKKAQLQLERTHLTAPFDGRVANKSVDVGQYVSPGQVMTTLYSTDAAEIVVPMETQDLYWFQVPGFTSDSTAGSRAEVRARMAGKELVLEGRVARSEGKLDARTRMINVVVRVEKPYAFRPPLAAGLFASVRIFGRTVDGVAVVPRSAMRPGQTVWVVKDGTLNFRKVDIARFEGGYVIIRSGLDDAETVVVSTVKAVSDGMKVRSTLVKQEEAP